MPEPIQHNLREADKQEAVRTDGLPRVARYLTTYDDGTQAETQHVLYRPNGIVQSMPAADWLAQRGPLPPDPTPAEIEAAILARQQAEQQALADAAALRQRVLVTLQSAVGVPFENLTNAQLRAVVEALAWQASALNKDTTLRPPADWIDRRR